MKLAHTQVPRTNAALTGAAHSLAPPFQRCMVLSGGGFRFGMYLGMYAAALNAGRVPDVLLGCCGGAIAASLIHALPDIEAAREWLCAPQMYDFANSIAATARAAPVTAAWQAAKRAFSGAHAAQIPDVFNDALFELAPQWPLPLPDASRAGPALIIIGAKLLFAPSQVGQARAGRKLFQQVLFGSQQALLALAQRPVPHAPLASQPFSDSAVAASVALEAAVPLPTAVHISTADLYYFPAVRYGGAWYSGGMVDLFPIELAHTLARTVVLERKAPLDRWLSAPAWRAGLGVDGNARLRAVQAQQAEAWIDTRDMRIALRHAQVQKKLDWRANRIRLVAPSYAQYVRNMHAQWHYGYARAAAAFGAAS
jgi:predicted acylesterase/phospholipase RssA